jgi:hypothetical protein
MCVAGLKLISFDRALKVRGKDVHVLEIHARAEFSFPNGNSFSPVPYTPLGDLEKYFPFDPMGLIVPDLRIGRRYGETITATSPRHHGTRMGNIEERTALWNRRLARNQLEMVRKVHSRF